MIGLLNLLLFPSNLIDGTAKVKRGWLCARKAKGPPRLSIAIPSGPCVQLALPEVDAEIRRKRDGRSSTADHERGIRTSGNGPPPHTRALMRFSPFAINNEDLAFPRVSRAIEIHPRPEIFIAGVVIAPVALLPVVDVFLCLGSDDLAKNSKEPSSIFRIGRSRAGCRLIRPSSLPSCVAAKGI